MNGFAWKIERLRRSLSQWEVARMADVPPYRISAFEQGRVELTRDELARRPQLMAHSPQRTSPLARSDSFGTPSASFRSTLRDTHSWTPGVS